MKAAKTPKNLKEMPYPPQKKLLKRKHNIAPAKTNTPILQTFPERLKLTTQTYRMRDKKLKMKFGQLHEEISKAPLPVSADLSNDFKSVILETNQGKNFILHEVILEGAAKIYTVFSNNTIHITP